MSPERSHAYQCVIKTLQELGPSKLFSDEQDLIRDAADSLIFSLDLAQDEAAQEAWDDAIRLCQSLVENGRWEPASATRLAEDLRRCGPEPAAEVAVA